MRKSSVPLSVVVLCFFALLAVFTLGGLLLWTGQKVQQYQTQTMHQNKDILAEQERIRILKAEWATLNSPARVERLMGDVSPAPISYFSDKNGYEGDNGGAP